jgi:hypothetical protein
MTPSLSHEDRAAAITRLRQLPAQLEALVDGLTEAQLDARPNGEWSVRQNVHHLADAHMNVFIRMKLALTEDQPIVKPFDQDTWAETPEACTAPIEQSLAILRGLHARWAMLFESLDDAAFGRMFLHPEHGIVTVEALLTSYANHGEAHLRQIRETLAAASA